MALTMPIWETACNDVYLSEKADITQIEKKHVFEKVDRLN